MKRRRFIESSAVLLAGTPYDGRLPIGTPEAIEAMGPEPLRRFYDDWYRPDLMAVIAVGDFDPETIEALIVESVDPEGPYGAKGIGESGTIADLHDATGISAGSIVNAALLALAD